MIDLSQVPEHITHWLTHYGSIALFGLLALGIIGLPIPDETLLVVSGLLIAKGELSPALTPIAAFAGSATGITLSYLIGRATEKTLLHRFGKYVGITEKKLEQAHHWFERFGKWILLVGYFIPGVRHLTGIISGATYLKYWEFALFAYTGALIWSMTFLAIGYFFYDSWLEFGKYIALQ